jgi:hypothetical protein
VVINTYLKAALSGPYNNASIEIFQQSRFFVSINMQKIHTLFIYSLFNDTFSSSDYTASNERIIVNNELESLWKKAVMA